MNVMDRVDFVLVSMFCYVREVVKKVVRVCVYNLEAMTGEAKESVKVGNYLYMLRGVGPWGMEFVVRFEV